MDILHIDGVTSPPFKMAEISALKCAGTYSSKRWTKKFLSSVVHNYLLQQDGKVLLALQQDEFEDGIFKDVNYHERAYPYLLEDRHSLYQIECYLRRLRDKGTEIDLVVISNLDALVHNYYKKGQYCASWVTKELRSEASDLLNYLRLLTIKFNCRFWVRSGSKTAPGISLDKQYPLYNIKRTNPSIKKYYLSKHKGFILFNIFDANDKTRHCHLSVLRRGHVGIFHFPVNLTPYQR